MMHIWGRLSRVVMACALSVLFLGGTGKTILAAPAISFTDIAGREVQLDKLPKTFVIANYIANFLMVGGAGSLDKVVGMTFDGWEETRYGEYVVYTETFPKLKAIPSIGGDHDNILDSEKILSLRPDVLLVGRSQFADNNQKIDIFEKAGIKVVVLDYHAMKVENHTKSTMILGQLLDREAVAKEQCDVYASALEDVYRKIAALPDSAKHKTVYMELGNKGIGEYGNSYNKDVLWGAILKNLGADNLAENATQPYAPLDTEFVLASNPQLIVIGGGITAARKYILPSLLAEMRGSLHTFSGETLPRVQMKVYDLDDATQFAAFAQGDSRRIKVYGSDREIVYDPQKRIGVMTSHIGASRAISLGAYAFALNSIDRDAR